MFILKCEHSTCIVVQGFQIMHVYGEIYVYTHMHPDVFITTCVPATLGYTAIARNEFG